MKMTKNAWKLLAAAVLLVFANIVASAQTAAGGGAPTGPVQNISTAQFNQMVQAGQLKLNTPEALVAQNLQALIVYLENLAVVGEFIRQNPNLPGYAQLVFGVPTDPNVVRTPAGNYSTEVSGQTIGTMGPAAVLTAAANSIRASSDPVRQLALYESFYSQYATLYNQVCAASPVGVSPAAGNTPPGACANLVLPSALTDPATLQNASLGSIQTALQSIGSLALNIINIVPLTSGGPVACSEQIGASSVADNNFFGDQTGSTSCKGTLGPATPSPVGILGNFNWPNKNLLSCVKNQGQRDNCHILAATSAMEEVIARDTGTYLNLSEQDFMEHEKLIWGLSLYGDTGDPSVDLGHAATFGYKFAYENQWDYNPAYSQPGVEVYQYSCGNYPYPSLVSDELESFIEPGCSNSAPQSLEFCAPEPEGRGSTVEVCGFSLAPLSGPTSPYMSTGTTSIWVPTNHDLSFDNMILSLAFNNAVLLVFNVTHNFEYGQSSAYPGYVPYGTPDAILGEHVVHIVGYVGNSDLASNPGTASAPPGAGGGYFIIKNSWGACFGDAGYVYLPVSYVLAEAVAVYVVSGENH
jgi:hypothetical protein